MSLKTYEFKVPLNKTESTVLCYESHKTLLPTHPLFFCQGATCFIDELTIEFVQDIFKRTKITHIIVYNYRGLDSGFTGVSCVNKYSTKLLVEDFDTILRFCDASIWKTPVKISIAGYSYGGVIMQEYLRYYGDTRIRSLVYILSLCFRCCRIDYKKLIQYAFRYQNFVKEESKIYEGYDRDTTEYWRRKAVKKKILVYQSLSMILDRIFDRDGCVYSMGDVRVPILLITAKNDEIFNYDKNKDCLTNRYPREFLRHVHLTDSQHNIFWKDPIFISNYFVNFYNEFENI